MSDRRLTIYGNWSAYDELSDGVPLTEELAMRQMDELLRLRSYGVRFDAYLMDAFWFDPDGGYRTWRTPNWPDGPKQWLEACAEHGLIPGLWFTANTLCHLKAAPAWQDSADDNGWGLCCFKGGFLADYLAVLNDWYQQGIRIFKIDFADFAAAPSAVKEQLTKEEIRSRNIVAFREGLIRFRMEHSDAIFMGFNGFESKEYMDRTDRPLEQVVDLKWLVAFDSMYSGDPRPADVPSTPFWRSVDIYGDHTTRVLEYSGIPLSRIDSCGFMAGPTGTCYWRGKALWKGMLLLTMARGGNLTVLYGDLSLFDEQDAKWLAKAQSLFEAAFEAGPSLSFGGVPGEGNPYGWVVGNTLAVVVNPSPITTVFTLPSGDWQILFCDSGYKPSLNEGSSTIRLRSFQMALIGRSGLDLGVQEDCIAEGFDPVSFEVIEQSERRLVVEAEPGSLKVIVRQRDEGGRLVRTFAGTESAATSLTMRAFQDGQPVEAILHHDRVVWSGMSWGAADFKAGSHSRVQIELETNDTTVARLDLEIWSAGD